MYIIIEATLENWIKIWKLGLAVKNLDQHLNKKNDKFGKKQFQYTF